jgi:hypothetical protein
MVDVLPIHSKNGYGTFKPVEIKGNKVERRKIEGLNQLKF